MTVTYDGAATEEAIDAAAWYDAQDDGLARRFLARWKEAEGRIIADPERFNAFDGDLRRCRFDKFPYYLVYRIRSNELEVIAVMHEKRPPGYWRNR